MPPRSPSRYGLDIVDEFGLSTSTEVSEVAIVTETGNRTLSTIQRDLTTF